MVERSVTATQILGHIHLHVVLVLTARCDLQQGSGHICVVYLTQDPLQTVADEYTPHPVEERSISSVILYCYSSDISTACETTESSSTIKLLTISGVCTLDLHCRHERCDLQQRSGQ